MIPDARTRSTLSRIRHQPDTLTERRSPAPSTWTRRVATSITNSTYSRLSNTVSTVQEVHRQHTLGLGPEELPPGERRPLGRRSNPGAPQDGPHRAGPDPALVPQSAQLAVDAAIPPGRVLPGQPQHQRADLGRHGRPRRRG